MKPRFIKPTTYWDRDKKRVSLRNVRGRSVLNLKAEDYEFAMCLDGSRTLEEALDHWAATTGKRIDRQAAELLLSRLQHAGFMEMGPEGSAIANAPPTITPPRPLPNITRRRWQIAGDTGHTQGARKSSHAAAKSEPQAAQPPASAAIEHGEALDEPRPSAAGAGDTATQSPVGEQPSQLVTIEQAPAAQQPLPAETGSPRPEKDNASTASGAEATRNKETTRRRAQPAEDDFFDLDMEGDSWQQAPGFRGFPSGGQGDRRAAAMRLLQQRAGGGRLGRLSQRGEENPEAQKKPKRKRIHLFELPVNWALPPSGAVSRLLESRLSIAAVVMLLLFAAFGIWFNRPALMQDMSKIFISWDLLPRLILILLTIDLSESLLRAGAIWRATHQTPKFSLELRLALMHAVPWFSFHTDLSLLRHMPDKPSLFRVISIPLLSRTLWIIASAILWMASRRSVETLSGYALEVLILASLFLILALNPLGKGPLYHLASLKLGMRNLRGLAFGVLFGKVDPQQRLPVSASALRIYAVSSILFMVAVTFLLVYFLGGWLTDQLGGLGALYLLVILALLFSDPLVKAYQSLKRGKQDKGDKQSAPTTQKGIWSRRLVYLAIFGLISLLPYKYETSGEFELLPASKSEIHTQVEGDIREVLVKEGEWVEAGQALVRLGSEDQLRNLKEIEQKIIELNALLLKAKSGATPEQIAVARQAVAAAQTRYDFSRRQVERYSQLLKEKFISEQSYENMRGQAESDRENLELAQRNLQQLLAGTRIEDIMVLQAQLESAQAQLDYYRHQMEATEVRSPIAGRVVSGTLMYAVGDHLKPEDPLMTIEDNTSLLVQIKIPETDIALLPEVSEVRLRAWSMPETSFTGNIQHVAPAAETGGTGRVVRVQVSFDNSKLKLPSALTGYAKVNCGEMPLLLAFTRMFVRFFMVEVWSWLP